MVRKRKSVHYWSVCKLVQPLWETVWCFLKELKVEPPYDPAIILLGIYPKNTKTIIQRDTCPFMFIAGLFTIAQIWKQPTEYIWNVYTHTHTQHILEYCSAINKNEILPFTRVWVELKSIMLSKRS